MIISDAISHTNVILNTKVQPNKAAFNDPSDDQRSRSKFPKRG